MQPVGVNQRMALGRDDLDMLEADALQIVGHHLGGLANVVFVLFGSADAGNAKQVFQFVKKALLIFAGIRNGGGNGCGCHKEKYSFQVEPMRMGKQKSISQSGRRGISTCHTLEIT